MKKVFFIFLMFGTIKNLGQTKNIFGWPKKPHLRSVKWFFFFFCKQFFKFEFLFLACTLNCSSFSTDVGGSHNPLSKFLGSQGSLLIVNTSQMLNYFPTKNTLRRKN
jgi:hypothetical protein